MKREFYGFSLPLLPTPTPISFISSSESKSEFTAALPGICPSSCFLDSTSSTFYMRFSPFGILVDPPAAPPALSWFVPLIESANELVSSRSLPEFLPPYELFPESLVPLSAFKIYNFLEFLSIKDGLLFYEFY